MNIFNMFSALFQFSMRITLCGLLAFLLPVCLATAQVDIRFGPEFGLIGYRIPQVDSAISSNGVIYNVTTQKPIFGFSLGLSGKLQWQKHWQVVSAVEYQRFGESTQWKFIYNAHNGGTSLHDDYVQRTIHKFAVPIMVGYNLGRGNFKPTLQTGVRTGLIVKHNDHFESYAPQPDFWNTTGPVSYSRDDDRFKGEFLRRWTLQLIGGLGTEIGENWFAGFNFAVGLPKYLPYYYGGDAELPNWDLSIRVAFRPFRKTRKPTP